MAVTHESVAPEEMFGLSTLPVPLLYAGAHDKYRHLGRDVQVFSLDLLFWVNVVREQVYTEGKLMLWLRGNRG